MRDQGRLDLDRRVFVTRLVPACSLACLGAVPLAAIDGHQTQEPAQPSDVHKFDSELSQTTSIRKNVTLQYRSLIGFIKTLQSQMDEKELVRLLNLYSADVGREVGRRQAQTAKDTSFQSFVSTFRPPNYSSSLTHTIVTDTERVFELRVTECVWASVFRDAGLGGAIGHAAVCNMDCYWPTAFNPSFAMERDKTLMQGNDHCNHRYIDRSA
jgi:hypothetical protein